MKYSKDITQFFTLHHTRTYEIAIQKDAFVVDIIMYKTQHKN